MRVALDYRPALFEGFGIGRYVRNLVPALLAADPDLELRLHGCFLRDHARRVREHDFPDDRRAKWVGRRFPARAIPWLARFLPIDARTIGGDFDLFHDTDYAVTPVRGRPRVATLYDTAYLADRGWVSSAQSEHMQRIVEDILEGVSRIITISEFAKTELVEAFALDPERITVTHLGVDPVFHEEADPEAIHLAQQAAGIEGPYVMYMGTLEPRKNVMRLVRAFARLVKEAPEYELVLVGRAGWASERVMRTIAEERIEDRVRILGVVPDEDARLLLKGADVFAYPSLYEGFGLPAIEGMAAGVPVLSSSSHALREICGDGALLVDPRDELQIFEGLRTLAIDRGEAYEIAARGSERARQFTWASCAERTLEAYRLALAESGA